MTPLPADRPPRAVIGDVQPAAEPGTAKASIGAPFVVTADVFGDGHDRVAAALCHRTGGNTAWSELPMEPLVNDRWQAEIHPDRLGILEYRLEAWSDTYGSWREGTVKKLAAGVDIAVEREEGALLIDDAAAVAGGADRRRLAAAAAELRDGDALAVLKDVEVTAAMWRCADRSPVAAGPVLSATVEPALARFSVWYELFPRSTVDGTDPAAVRHGTLRDVVDRLPYVAGMGFDVLYLPPIHPIGDHGTQGPEQPAAAGPDDAGSPWAIGAGRGPHRRPPRARHAWPTCGTLVAAAADAGIDVALDLAFQCSPDHPWVTEHPTWFRHRPDGTIKYAENPPKKYEDIYPLDFETETGTSSGSALRDVVRHWVDAGRRGSSASTTPTPSPSRSGSG